VVLPKSTGGDVDARPVEKPLPRSVNETDWPLETRDSKGSNPDVKSIVDWLFGNQEKFFFSMGLVVIVLTLFWGL
jgi:hypothetical protein